MSFRDSIERISPPFLLDRVGRRLGYTIGLTLDAFELQVKEGVKARMPLIAPPDALPYIGRDRLIDRGPTESDESYAQRLSMAFDAWRRAGSARVLLEQLQAYFLPARPSICVVSDRGVWHEIDSTGAVTRTRTSPSNWVWDAHASALSATPRWHRAWVIIDATGRWTKQTYGSGLTYGSGATYGSTATREEVVSIRRIVRKWKPQHVFVPYVIAKFDPTLFRPENAPGVNMPNGNWDQYANRHPDAAYWPGVI